MAGNVPPLTITLPVPFAEYVPTDTTEADGAASPLVKPGIVHTISPLPLAVTSEGNEISSDRCSSKKLQYEVTWREGGEILEH
jgi:hypothetical protein